MSRVVEGNGAQVLPPVRDPRSTVSSWEGHLAANADLRTKNAFTRHMAATLIVEATS